MKLVVAQPDDQSMRRIRSSQEPIIGIPKEHEAGVADLDVYRKCGVLAACIWKWKVEFAGMDLSRAKRLWALEDENAKLKRMVADATLDNVALKDLPGMKW